MVTEEITAALAAGEEQMRCYDISNMAAMVDLAAEQITDDKKNIYTILFALQRWCEALELSVAEARKVALFCIVGDPERGLDPLEQFRCPAPLLNSSLAFDVASVHSAHAAPCATALVEWLSHVYFNTLSRRRRFLWTLRGIPGLAETGGEKINDALEAAHLSLAKLEHD